MKNINSTKLMVAVLSIYCLAVSITAQSTNQSEPTQFSGAEYTGKGPSKETLYFFGFTGGPGEVTVRLEIKAKQYSTFARLEVLDAELNTLATHNMNAATTSGSQQVLKKINLDEKQTVLLKVTLDSNLANYKIVLGGAIETGTPTTDSGASTPTDTPPADTGGGVPPSTESGPSEASPGPSASTGGNKFFNIDFGKFKLGQFINMPKTGTLVIQLKDGTTQEIDIASVKSVTVKK
jgi:hypothetical protein